MGESEARIEPYARPDAGTKSTPRSRSSRTASTFACGTACVWSRNVSSMSLATILCIPLSLCVVFAVSVSMPRAPVRCVSWAPTHAGACPPH